MGVSAWSPNVNGLDAMRYTKSVINYHDKASQAKSLSDNQKQEHFNALTFWKNAAPDLKKRCLEEARMNLPSSSIFNLFDYVLQKTNYLVSLNQGHFVHANQVAIGQSFNLDYRAVTLHGQHTLKQIFFLPTFSPDDPYPEGYNNVIKNGFYFDSEVKKRREIDPCYFPSDDI